MEVFRILKPVYIEDCHAKAIHHAATIVPALPADPAVLKGTLQHLLGITPHESVVNRLITVMGGNERQKTDSGFESAPSTAEPMLEHSNFLTTYTNSFCYRFRASSAGILKSVRSHSFNPAPIFEENL